MYKSINIEELDNVGEVQSFSISGFDLIVKINNSHFVVENGVSSVILDEKSFTLAQGKVVDAKKLIKIIGDKDSIGWESVFLDDLIGGTQENLPEHEEISQTDLKKLQQQYEKMQEALQVVDQTRTKLEAENVELEELQQKLAEHAEVIKAQTQAVQDEMTQVLQEIDSDLVLKVEEIKDVFEQTSTSAPASTSTTATSTSTASSSTDESTPETTKVIETITPTIDNLFITAELDYASDSGDKGDSLTNHTTPILSGNTLPNIKVIVVFADKSFETLADDKGYWSFSYEQAMSEGLFDSVLVDGNYDYSVNVSNGEISEAASGTISVITQPPLITVGLDDSQSNNLTNDNTPKLSGTVTANAAIASVLVLIDGNSYEVAVDESGNWSLQLPQLPDGEFNYVIQAEDVVGNQSDKSDTFTIDTVVDNDEFGLHVDSDSGVVGDDITKVERPTLSGKTEAGAEVKISLDGGSSYLDVTTLDTDGNWTFVYPDDLAQGEHEYILKIKDVVGNESTFDGAFTVDASIELSGGLLSAVSDKTSDTTPMFSGNADPGATIVVTVNGNSYQTQSDVDGKWAIQIADALDYDNYDYTIHAKDAADNEATLQGSFDLMPTVIIDDLFITAELDNTTNSGDKGDSLTNYTKPILSGTTLPNMQVTVTFADKTFTTQADAQGNWSFSYEQAMNDGHFADVLADGDYQYEVTVSDPQANMSDTTSGSISVITQSPVITGGLENNESVTNDNTLTLSGSVSGNADIASVSVVIDGKTYQATVGDSGNWSLQLPQLPDGEFDYVIQAEDVVGNQSNKSDTLTIDTLVDNDEFGLHIDSDSGIAGDGITKVERPTLSGQTEAGAEVKISLDGGSSYLDVTTLDTDGNWTFVYPDDLAQGEHEYILKIKDAAGNEATFDGAFTVDASIELTGGLISSVSDKTSDTTPMFSGNADPGATIVVTVNGNSYQTQSDSDGKWAIQIADTLGYDVYDYTIHAKDAADNNATLQGSFELMPTVIIDDLFITAELNSATDSGIVGDNLTNNTTPILSGTTLPNMQVTVTFADKTFTTQADAQGNWSFSYEQAMNDGHFADVLADGDYQYEVTVTDPQGNMSDATSGTIIVVTQLPTITAELEGNHSSSVNNDNTPKLSGTVTANAAIASVLVLIDGNSYEVAVDESGNWSLQLPQLSDGEFTYVVQAEDVVGNQSNKSATLTIDTVVDNDGFGLHTDSDSGVKGDEITKVKRPTLSGKTETGATVTISLDDGSSYLDVTTKGDGSWTFTYPDDLAEGEHEYTLKIKDAAGNESTFDGAFTVDASIELSGGLLSSVSDKTSDTTPMFSGHADPGAIIVVTVNNKSYQTQSDVDGKWAIQISDALDYDSYDYTIHAKDAADNEATLQGSFDLMPTVVIDDLFITAELNGATNSGDKGDSLTNHTKPILSGTTLPNMQVTVTFADKTFTTQADALGNWSFSYDAAMKDGKFTDELADGNYQYEVIVTDPQGNMSKTTSGSISVITQLPTITAGLDGNQSSSLTDDNTPKLSGTVTANAALASVLVLIDGNSYEVAVDESGNWSLQLPQLSDGEFTYVVQAEDVVGNQSNKSATLTIDTVVDNDGFGLHTDSDSGVKGDEITKVKRPTLSGKTEAGATVTISLDDGSSYLDVTTKDDGSWTFTYPDDLAEGEHEYTLKIKDAAGNESTFDGAFTVDASIELSGGLLSSVSDKTSDTTPMFTGHADPGAIIVVTVNNKSYQTQSDVDGKWAIQISDALDYDSYDYTIYAKDAADNSTTLQGSFDLMPTVVIDDLFITAELNDATNSGDKGDSLTNHTKPILSGTTLPNMQVTVTFADKTFTTQADAQGNWSFSYEQAMKDGKFTDELADGNYQYEVTVTDPQGNMSKTTSGSISVITQSPTITAGLDGNQSSSLTDDNTPKLSGTVTANAAIASVLVLIDGNSYEVAVDESGNWSLQLPQLSDGEFTYVIQAEDVVGNQSNKSDTITIDTVVDNDGFGLHTNSDSGVAGDEITKVERPTLSGKAEAGAEVKISLDGGSSYLDVTTLDTDGNWTFAYPNDLAEGEHEYTLKIKDAAGNEATFDGAFTVDASIELSGGLLSSVSDKTSDTTPVFTGHADPGATIVVTVNGNSYQTQSDVDGKWAIQISDALDYDNYDYTIYAKDTADNSTTLQGSFDLMPTVIIDDLFITAELNDAANSGDKGDSLTNHTKPILSGTTLPNMQVTVTFADKTFTTQADAQGNWSFSYEEAMKDGKFTDKLADGNYQYEVTVTDPQGNMSKTTSGSISVITQLPTITAGLDGSQSSSLTDNNTPKLSGTVTANAAIASVLVLIDGNSYEVAVDESGNWSLQLPQLPDGELTYVVQAEDVVGNHSNKSATLTIDTIVDNEGFGLHTNSDSGLVGDEITKVERPTLSGKTEAGAEVTISLDGGNSYRDVTTLDTDGNWTFVYPNDLAEGEHEYTLKVKDAAGNEASFDGAFTVDTQLNFTGELISESPNTTALLRPIFGGTAETGTQITIKIYDRFGAEVVDVLVPEGTIDEDGHWTFQIPDTLTFDQYSYKIYAEDVAGNNNNTTPSQGSLKIEVAGQNTSGSVTTFQLDANIDSNDHNDTGIIGDKVTSNNTPRFIANSTAASYLIFTIESSNGASFNPQRIDFTSVNTKFTWPSNSPLDDGTYFYKVESFDVNGNSLGYFNDVITIDTTPPIIEDVVMDSNRDSNIIGDFITYNPNPFFDVHINEKYVLDATAYIETASGSKIDVDLIDQAKGDGHYRIENALNLGNGTYTLNINVTDQAGNTTNHQQEITIDYARETFNINWVGGNWYTDGKVHFFSENGFNITLGNNVSDDRSGTFTVRLQNVATRQVYTYTALDGEIVRPGSALPVGEYTTHFYYTDAAGNISSATNKNIVHAPQEIGLVSFETDKVELAKDISYDGVIPSFSGEFEARHSNKLTYSGEISIDGKTYPISIGSHTNSLNIDSISWSWTPPSNFTPLTEGDKSVTVTIRDNRNNEEIIFDGMVDLPFPLQVELTDASNSGSTDDYITSDTKPTLKGDNAEAGEVLHIMFQGNSYSVTADANGEWTWQLPDVLGNNTYPITVSGSSGKNSTTEINLVIDNVNNTLTHNDIPGDAGHDWVTIDGNKVYWTGGTSSVFKGIAEPFATVTARLTIPNDDGSFRVINNTVTADKDGNYSVSLENVPNGFYDNVTISSVDLAGNTHSINTELVVRSKYTEGDISLTETTNSDVKISHSSDDTSKPSFKITDPTISGNIGVNVQPGETIQVTVYQNDVEIHSGNYILNNDGSYFIDDVKLFPDTSAGSAYTVHVSLPDKWASDSSLTFENHNWFNVEFTDTPPIATAELDDSNQTGFVANYTQSDDITLTGTTDAYSKVTVTIGGKSYVTHSDQDGVWSLNFSESFAEGQHDYTVNVLSTSGLSGSYDYFFVVDNGEPDITVESELFENGLSNQEDNHQIRGKVAPKESVEVTINDTSYTKDTVPAVQMDDQGNWTLDVDGLTHGDYQYEIKVTTPSGVERTQDGSFVIDTVAETITVELAESSDSGIKADKITNNTTPTFTGRFEANSIITLTIDGQSYKNIPTDENGDWAYTLPNPLLEDTYTYSVQGEDHAGNSSNIVTEQITIQLAPLYTSTDLTGGLSVTSSLNNTDTSTPSFSGTSSTHSDSASVVRVTIGQHQYLIDVNKDTGEWTLDIPYNQPLQDGSHTIKIEELDKNGNVTGTVNTDFEVDTVCEATFEGIFYADEVIESGMTNQKSLTFKGTAEQGSTIVIQIPSTNGLSHTIDPSEIVDGNWHSSSPVIFPEGNHAYIVTVTDKNGNTSTFNGTVSVDTQTPEVFGSLDSSDVVLDTTTTNNQPTISGITEPYASVVIKVNQGEEYLAEADEYGNWQWTFETELDDGHYAFEAIATDVHGNSSDPLVGEFDVVATPPSTDCGLSALTNSGIESTAQITSHQSPDIIGTTRPNSTVTITFQGNDYPITVAPNGSWTFSPSDTDLDSGTYPYTVTVVDLYGNVGTQNHSFIIDVTAPDEPDVLTSDLVGTATPEFSGTVDASEVGALITLVIGTTTYTAKVAENGDWSIDLSDNDKPDLLEGSHNYSLKLTDRAGNESTSVSGTIEVDLTAPKIENITVDDTDSDTPTIHGKSEAGATITLIVTDANGAEVFNSANLVAPIVAGADGSWSQTLPAISDGIYSYQIKAKDEVGHESVNSNDFQVESNTLASIDEFINEPMPTFSGTTQAGSTLVLTITNGNGTVTHSYDESSGLTVTGSGWSFTLPDSLQEGEWNYSVQTTSPNGVVNTTTGGFNVDVTAPNEPDVLTNDLIGTATPEFSGTVDASEVGALITLTIGTTIYTTKVAENGVWSIDLSGNDKPDLLEGSHNYTLKLTDVAGNTSTTASGTVKVDLTAPKIENLTVDGVDSDTPTIHGKSEAGATITLIVTDANGAEVFNSANLVAPIVAGADGSWSHTLSAVQDGVYSYQIKAQDEVGHISSETTGSLTINTSSPSVVTRSYAPTFLADSEPLLVSEELVPEKSTLEETHDKPQANPDSEIEPIIFEGVSLPEADITFTVNDENYLTQSNQEGEWSIEIAGLTAGIYQYQVEVVQDNVLVNSVSSELEVVDADPILSTNELLPDEPLSEQPLSEQIALTADSDKQQLEEVASQESEPLLFEGAISSGKAVTQFEFNGQNIPIAITPDGEHWQAEVPMDIVAPTDNRYKITVQDTNGDNDVIEAVYPDSASTNVETDVSGAEPQDYNASDVSYIDDSSDIAQYEEEMI